MQWIVFLFVGIVVAFKRLDHLVELTKKLGNKIEAAALHVIGKNVLEENPSNSKILMKSAFSLWKDLKSKSNLTLRKEKSIKSVIKEKNPDWACHFIFIITFGSNIGLRWIWWSWKANEKCNK
jgi:hypothetical protein